MRERAVIDAARQASEASEKETKDKEESVFTFPLTSPFVLPSEAIYNIFHPSDPVAYRIEPLLLPEATIQSNIPDPLYLVKQGQGVRLHLKAKQIGDDIRRSFAETANTWTSMINAVTEQAVSALSKAAEEENEREKGGASHLRPGELTFPLGGKSQRVDYQLQPGVIDNEYVSAVTAHSSYFSNSDIRDFLIELTTVKEEIPESLVLEGSVDEQEKTKNLAAEMKLDALLDGDLIQNDNGGNNAE
jgi:hypothetical protein